MKQEAYIELTSKFREYSIRNTRSQSPTPATSKPRLQNILKQVTIYSKEKASLTSKVTNISLNHELDLVDKIKILEEKLALLVKENLRLNTFRTHGLPPIAKIHNESEEDLQREMKFLQKNIAAVEDAIRAQAEKFKAEQERNLELSNTFESLKRNTAEIRQDNLSNKANALKNKLKIVQNSWKSNVLKMENMAKECENQLKLLQDKETKVRSRIFKQDQQRRLLEMSHDDYKHMKREGLQISDTPDVYHPDAGFLYKPSVKALYTT